MTNNATISSAILSQLRSKLHNFLDIAALSQAFDTDHSDIPLTTRNRMISLSVETLCEQLRVSELITTVRERSGYRRQRLRSIFTQPKILEEYFRKIDSEPDKITTNTFAEPHSNNKAHTNAGKDRHFV